MKALIQRVTSASVQVDGQTIGKIGQGIVVLLGITRTDTEKEVDYVLEKVVNCRIFPGDNPLSDFDKSLLDIQGGLLIVSQFTLYGNLKKGRRPDFAEAAKPETAEKLYNLFVQKARQKQDLKVAAGQFKAHMEVGLTNDGPVTIMIES
ncbi:D-tyrosyl-tRNA(Tyr) deacylase [Candidatus Peregrinibacteria bacterium]|nr:D-tyrosyl-tRNA(Tyr) deacylase [Candidatus Peregrinibacteria bacterium]